MKMSRSNSLAEAQLVRLMILIGLMYHSVGFLKQSLLYEPSGKQFPNYFITQAGRGFRIGTLKDFCSEIETKT